MAELKIDNGAWVVVCDGAKALVLANEGNRKTPRLITREVYQQEDRKTREIGTDKPGRSFNSVDEQRSAMEQTDFHRQEEERFLSRLAERLDKAVLGGETRALIVVAPPRAIGVLRREFSPHVRGAV
jgi:protein required for attachment to host cells